MAYQDTNAGGGMGGGFQRAPMVDVSSMGIKCADCGIAITELPFMPKRTEGIYCREHLKDHKKPSFNRGPRRF